MSSMTTFFHLLLLPKLPLISPLFLHKHPFSTKLTFSHIFQHYSKKHHHRPRRQQESGKQAHAYMITTGFSPTVYVTNCLIHMYCCMLNLDYARKVFDSMSQRDAVSWNSMISGYVQCGSLDMTMSLFRSMPGQDVVSWNTVISGYLQSGKPCEAIALFLEMRRSGAVVPDRTTFAIVLKACASLEEYELGVQIHGLVERFGLDLDVVAGSAVLDMYAKCGRLGDSLQFFNEMPERNLVSWSAVIAGCVQNEEYMDGLELFIGMQREGVGVSQSAYASILRSCAALASARVGGQIHTHALKHDFGSDIVVGTAILDMYAKSDRIGDARRLFDSLPTRTLQSWNAIIVGCVRNHQGLDALELFRVMSKSNIGVDEISLSGIFSACAEVKGYVQGSQAHCFAIKNNLISDICVSNAILDMYGKCRALVEARIIFKEMNGRDAVSWNAIISALEQNDQYEDTLIHFNQMLQCGMEPDEFTYGSVLKACASLESLNPGMKVHDKIIKCGLGLDAFVGSALIDMYCKCGAIEEALKLHHRIELQTIVSWNAITSGFSLHNRSEEAHKFFFKMLSIGLKPDNFTYATVLDSCANLATVGLGKQIHAQIIKDDLQKDVFVSSSLVDMYAKCGSMMDSLLMFEKMAERDFVSWNALICGYSQHGFSAEALGIFRRMQHENVGPNHATFLAVLRACGHVGLFDEGEQYFKMMTDHYKLDPQLEHYSCMVDLVGRSRGVKEALKLINDMPFEADDVIWRTLLSACKIQGNVEIAEIAASSILQLDPEDSSAYVLLSNIYAEAGRWAEVSKLRKLMRKCRLKKEPGCSWIEVKSEMHAFLAGDKAHPRSEEIYERLDELIGEMMRIGDVTDIDLTFDFLEEVYDQESAIGLGNG